MIPKIEFVPGYEISRIIKGNWQLASDHSKEVDYDSVLEDLYEYAKNGITTFDMADIYTGVEEIFGRFRAFLQKKDPQLLQKIKIHTKYVPDRNKLANLKFEDTEAIIDRSLKRLGMESLDLVQFHWWDYNIQGYLKALESLFVLKEKGKIKEIGLTNFNQEKLEEMFTAGLKPKSMQVQYSLLDRRVEKNLTDYCLKKDVKFFCYGVLAGGFLSDRWLEKEDPGLDAAKHSNRSLTKYRLIIEDFGGWNKFQELLSLLRKIADKHNANISEVATKYILEKPNVAATILGSKNTKHIKSTLNIFNFNLSEKDKNEIKDFLSSAKMLEGDFYDLERESALHAGIMKYNLNKK